MTAVGMVVISRHSDKTGERHRHVAFAMAWGGFFMLVSVLLSRQFPSLSFLAISLVGAGSYGALGPFWAIPTETLPRTASGSAMGLVNALGNLGGYFGPLAVGYINQHTGNFRYAFGMLSAAYFTGSLVILLLRPETGAERVGATLVDCPWAATRVARYDEDQNMATARMGEPEPARILSGKARKRKKSGSSPRFVRFSMMRRFFSSTTG